MWTGIVRALPYCIALTVFSTFACTTCLGQFTPTANPEKAAAIEDRDHSGNGIYIQSPKIYDDMSLQLMLNSARAQLASAQTINPTSLQAAVGALSGGTAVQNSFAAQLSGGPPLGQVAQTLAGPTSQTAATTGSTPSTTVTTTAPNQSTVTTTAAPTVPTASLPSGSGVGLPTTFGVNALNVLNEQMQLTYEITNLQLLLEGALSDRFVAQSPFLKARTTIGFPITIDPPKEYKNSVAVVEVVVGAPTAHVFDFGPPAITALLPKEKTFNVAAITNKQASIGAGFATAVIGGGFSFLHGRSTYYVVQDQDTLALQLAPPHPTSETAFGWQFKPVLGQKYVQSGMRQTFVQLAVPIDAFAGCFSTLHVTTYWREFDSKTGKSGDVIPESVRTYSVFAVPVYDLAPFIQNLSYEDLGNGQVEVEILGQFITGTYVRVGSIFYQSGTPGFTMEATRIRFTAAASDLLKFQPQLVSRDGTEVPIVNPADPPVRRFLNASCTETTPPLKGAPPPPLRGDQRCGETAQLSATASVLDQSTSLLTVLVRALPAEPNTDQYMLNLSGHVYGLNDSPISRTAADECTTAFQAAVPSETLASLKTITVQPLLWSGRHSVPGRYYETPFGSVADKIVLLQKGSSSATFLLIGNRLEAARMVAPQGRLMQFPSNDPKDPYSMYSLAKFDLPLTDWKAYKSILIQKSPGEKVEQVSLPSPDDATGAQALSVKFHPAVGTDELQMTGGDIESIKSASYNAASLTISLSQDKKTLIVRGLVSAGVTQAPTPKDIVFVFKDGHKATVNVDVVNLRIEANQAGGAATPAKP